MAKRHRQVWNWFERVRPGEDPPDPEVHIWPRGGGKSTTIQLGIAYVGKRLSRRFVLYVSGTQDQANEHVASIADLLESQGVKPLKGEHGNQKGWRKAQLRTDTGFNVVGIGLDVAARGIKLGNFRPDLVVLDDLDDSEDTAKTTARKVRLITRKILKAGSIDKGVLVMQNLIIPDGVVAQLYDGRADYLSNRTTFFDVAVKGLETKLVQGEDGKNRHVIVKGQATWEGQNLATCQKAINDDGLSAFLVESQHEVHHQQGYFFNESQFQKVEYDEVFGLDENDEPLVAFTRVCRAWDYAGTQGAGDFTVGVLMGITGNGVIWILDVVRAQLSSDNAKKLQDLVHAWDRSKFGNKYTVRTPQDPGSAGKRVAEEDAKDHGAKAVAVTGKKAVRARKYAECVNDGNARYLSDAGYSRTLEIDDFLADMVRMTELDGKATLWNAPFLAEHRKFTEDDSHAFDDQIDAGADAFNELNIAPVQVFVGRA